MKPVRVFAVMMVVMVAACAKKPKPEMTPTPEQAPPAVVNDNADAERAAREAEARRREAERMTATLTEMVHFDYDRADLNGEARAILDRKVPILNGNQGIRIRVDGHADERGTIEYNLALSLRRAGSVKEYLAGFGISPERIEVAAFGEERPLVQGENEAAWARNRRAEFHIVSGVVANR